MLKSARKPAACRFDRQLAAAMRNRLSGIQRQLALSTGLLGQTGLSLEAEPSGIQIPVPGLTLGLAS